jgi:hypothetical protein
MQDLPVYDMEELIKSMDQKMEEEAVTMPKYKRFMTNEINFDTQQSYQLKSKNSSYSSGQDAAKEYVVTALDLSSSSDSTSSKYNCFFDDLEERKSRLGGVGSGVMYLTNR